MKVRRIGFISKISTDSMRKVLENMNSAKLNPASHSASKIEVIEECIVKRGNYPKITNTTPSADFYTPIVTLNGKEYYVSPESGKVLTIQSFREYLLTRPKSVLKAIAETIDAIKDNFSNPDVIHKVKTKIPGHVS